MRYELGRRRRLKSFARAACLSALAAVFVASAAPSSEAGKRHRHHPGHVHHRHYHPPAVVPGHRVFGWTFHRHGAAHRRHRKRPIRRFHGPVFWVHVAPAIRYVVPAAVPPPTAAIHPTAVPPADCLMIREYQARIVVGGREVEAYGDACLQPDGSWRTGPPKLVPP